MDSHVHAADHLARRGSKRDFLVFLLELARELVGYYCSRQHNAILAQLTERTEYFARLLVTAYQEGPALCGVYCNWEEFGSPPHTHTPNHH